jgi:hypothetical protein
MVSNYGTDTTFQSMMDQVPVVGQISDAVQSARNIYNAISQAFGKGRREADLIVPFQNQLGDLLGLVDREMQYATSVDQLWAIGVELQSAADEFYKFIGHPTYSPPWEDGRAGRQAYATIEPQVTGRLVQLRNRITAAGGIPPAKFTASILSGADTTQLVMVGVVALVGFWLLTKG